jgi:two-component system, chemotaxis family, sensor kinase CheA
VNEFVEQFLIECRELVEQATHDLLALEERPDDRERLDSAFRAFHTLKGAAGIVDFAAMGLALHAAENVLSAVRTGEQPVTAALISDCLTCIDQVVRWLDAMAVTGDPPQDAGAAAEALVARFGRAAAPDEPRPTAVSAAEEAGPGMTPLARDLLMAQLALLADRAAEASPGRAASAARVAINLLRRLRRGEDAEGLERLVVAQHGRAPDPEVLAQAMQRLVDGALTLAPDAASREAPEPARGLRVEIERVDALVNLTGELTVAKNALAYAAGLAREGTDHRQLATLLKDQHAVLDRLVGELQRSVLNIRVLPLRNVFQRFPRLVREMVAQLGKPARLVTEGDATEADKAVVEALFEPLLHVLRNALDHGVEGPEARTAAGKPPSATVVLRAAREGDRVLVEVEDDGGGIDIGRVREVAVARDLLTREAADEIADAALLDLIFAPGFSTAAQVSSLSGRGVGMDSVRTAVQRLGGRVAIHTRAGEGTTVRFVLPFTVMMTQVMTVEAGGQMFGIPLEAVVETVRLAPDVAKPVGDARAFVLRDRTVPLMKLREVLGGGASVDEDGDATVVVAVAGGGVAGLQVDRLGERMEVMLRPMDGLLAGTPGVAGTTLLGDGRVLIVLDLHDMLG